MTLLITTPPTVEPVSVAELKAELRVTIDAEEALIAALITAARQRIEAELGLALVSTGFRQSFDRAPDGPIPLARAPLISVEAVAVKGAAGWAALDPSAYIARIGARDAQIAPVSLVWPTPVPPIEGVRVDYTAGFGATADAVPAPLQRAILALAAHAFDHRGEEAPAPIALVEPWLAPYRRMRL